MSCSCFSNLANRLGSGIRTMFSPTPYHTCPVDTVDDTITSGLLMITESGNFIISEGSFFIETE